MTMGGIIGSTLILIIIVLLLVWLFNIIYKTYIVKAKLTKVIERVGNHNYNSGDSPYFISYYYSFKTKKGIEKRKDFSGFTFIKKGQSRLIFYSEDKDKLVGKVRTPFLLTAVIIFLFLGLVNVGLEICIISIVTVLLTIIMFVVNYNKKYVRDKKNG